MKIQTAQYIAKKQNGSYAVSAYRYQETTDDRSFQKGDLYCLLSLESEEDIQATTLSKFVWDGIIDAYLYSEAKTANEAIMASLKMGEKKVRDLIKNDKDLEDSGVNLNFALIANKKDGFYIGVYGDMEVFVYREGSFVCISEVLKKNGAKTAGIVLKKDEFLATSTPELFSAFVDSFDNNAGIDAIEASLESIEASLEGLEGIFTLRVEEDLKINLDVGRIEEEGVGQVDGEKEIQVNDGIKKPLDEIKTFKEKKKLFDGIKGEGKLGIVLSKIGGFFDKLRPFFVKIKEKISVIFKPLIDGIGEKLQKKKFFKKVGSKMSEIRFKQAGRKPQGFRIDGYKAKNLKRERIKIVVVAFVAIVSISLFIRFIIIKKNEAELHTLVTQQMDTAEGYMSDAQVNIVKDKNEAESSLYLAKGIFDELSAEISDEDLSRKESLLLEYRDLEDSLLSRKGVMESDSTLVEYIDTRLSFGEKSNTTDILYYKDTSENEYLYISDEGSKSVYRVSIYDKDIQKIPDEEGLLKTPQYIDFGYDGLYVYDSTQGVLRASFSDGFNGSFEDLTGVKSRDLDDDSIAEMAILTETDNIYLLSKNEKAILKSSRTGSGYGLTYPYVSSESFATANDFFSDFTIYVLRPGSDGLETYIYNYLTFEYSYSPLKLVGLRKDLENLSAGYTSGSLDFGLYVFDSTQKIFIKFEKPQEGIHTGELLLKQQYVYRGSESTVFSNIKDFVVDGNEKYMYVLDGKSVWKVAL